jgi:hypothetical protein
MADGGSYLDFENIKNQAKTADVGTPDPKKTMIFFMMLSLIYGIFVSTTILSSTSIEQVEENSTNFIFILIYILLLIIGMYFLNLNIAKSICQNDTAQYSNVFFATILPWIIVFGILYFILEIFTGWVRPFSNTIGYVVVSLLGVEDKIKNLLNKDPKEQSITQALIQIEQNKSKFINEFEPDQSQFKEFIERLRKEKLTITDSIGNKISEDELELFKLVNIKHIIGKLMWYILAGTVISSISYNYIINIKCTQTLKDVEKLIESQNK